MVRVGRGHGAWGSARARWRSGLVMSASRCSPTLFNPQRAGVILRGRGRWTTSPGRSHPSALPQPPSPSQISDGERRTPQSLREACNRAWSCSRRPIIASRTSARPLHPFLKPLDRSQGGSLPRWTAPRPAKHRRPIPPMLDRRLLRGDSRHGRECCASSLRGRVVIIPLGLSQRFMTESAEIPGCLTHPDSAC